MEGSDASGPPPGFTTFASGVVGQGSSSLYDSRWILLAISGGFVFFFPVYIQGCAVIIYMAVNICSNSGCCNNDPDIFGWVPSKQMFYFRCFGTFIFPKNLPVFLLKALFTLFGNDMK